MLYRVSVEWKLRLRKNRMQYVSKRHLHYYSCSDLITRPWGWGEEQWVLGVWALTLVILSSPEDLQTERCSAASLTSLHSEGTGRVAFDFQPYFYVNTLTHMLVNMFLTLFNIDNAFAPTCCFYSVVLVFAVPFTFPSLCFLVDRWQDSLSEKEILWF